MNDSYDMADSTIHHFDCQKRAVCEMFRYYFIDMIIITIIHK